MADQDPRAAVAAAIERNNANAELLRARGMMNLAQSRGAFYAQMGMQATGVAADMIGGFRNAGAVGGAIARPALDFSTVLQGNPYAAQQGLLSTIWTAYGGPGSALPFSRFSGQMMSMNVAVAQEQARTFLAARMSDIGRGAAYNIADTLSFGLAGYGMRAMGAELSLGPNRQLARDIVARQFRGFTAREIGGDVSELGFGLGANATTRTIERLLNNNQLRQLQRETGFSGAQLLELTDIAGQATLPSKAVSGGIGGRINQLAGGAGQVLEIMRTLGMDSEELQGYMQAMDQVYSNLDDLQGMAQEATRLRRATRVDHRVLLQGLAQAREVTRGAYMGMEEGGGIFSGLTQIYNQQIESGTMPMSEVLRYGGRQQAAAAMAMARYRQNVAMVQGGAGRDLVTLAAADPAALARLGAGGMGVMGMGQAVGGVMAADPFAALRAQTNPAAQRAVAANLDFYQWRQAMSMRGVMLDPVQMVQRYARDRGISMAQAATEMRMFELETAEVGRRYGATNQSQADRLVGARRMLAGRGQIDVFESVFATNQAQAEALNRLPLNATEADVDTMMIGAIAGVPEGMDADTMASLRDFFNRTGSKFDQGDLEQLGAFLRQVPSNQQPAIVSEVNRILRARNVGTPGAITREGTGYRNATPQYRVGANGRLELTTAGVRQEQISFLGLGTVLRPRTTELSGLASAATAEIKDYLEANLSESLFSRYVKTVAPSLATMLGDDASSVLLSTRGFFGAGAYSNLPKEFARERQAAAGVFNADISAINAGRLTDYLSGLSVEQRQALLTGTGITDVKDASALSTAVQAKFANQAGREDLARRILVRAAGFSERTTNATVPKGTGPSDAVWVKVAGDVTKTA